MRWKRVSFSAAIFGWSLFLAACASLPWATPQGGDGPGTVRVVCPSVYEIDRETQEKALLEWARLQAGNFPVTIELLEQYGELRAKIRACNGEAVK